MGSPEFSGSFGFQWRGQFGSSDIGWRLNSNYSFQSDAYIGAATDGNPQSIQDGFGLLDARFTIESLNDSWSLSVFGSNLFDKGYCTVRFPQPLDAAFGLRNGVFPGSTGIRCTEGTPRTYGATATYRF